MQYRLKSLSFAVERHVVLFQQPGHADPQIAFPTRPAHTQSDRACYHRRSSILQTNNSSFEGRGFVEGTSARRCGAVTLDLRLSPLALLHTHHCVRGRTPITIPQGEKEGRVVCSIVSTDRHIAPTLDAVPQGKHNVNSYPVFTLRNTQRPVIIIAAATR
jgi:hypothetical protein